MRKLYFAGCVIVAAACLGGCTKTNEIEPVSKGSGGGKPMPVVIVQKNYNVSQIVVNVLLY